MSASASEISGRLNAVEVLEENKKKMQTITSIYNKIRKRKNSNGTKIMF